ncbi:MAG: Wzz/FepE/Etk N-terminal domain-containing protein [Actinomycetota bacterium]
MDLVEHFRLIWRRRWLILGVSIVIAGLVFARSRTLPKVYEATATIDVIPTTVDSDESFTEEQVGLATDRFAALAGATTVLEDAVERSGLDIGVGTARGRASASGSSDPGFVEVRAEGPSPRAADALADGLVDALIEAAAGETAPDAEPPPGPRVVSPARASSSPIRPQPSRDALLAFLVALVVNAELAALLGFLAGRLPAGRVREEVERVTDVPVLARIPRRGRDEVVEAFRELRAQVEFARGDVDVRSVAVTSVEPGAGASFVARGLAQISANLKASVVLVDANLRRPSVAAELNLPPSPGLGDVLLGTPFDPSLLRQANPLQTRFRVLTAGLAVPDAPGLLGAGALRKLLDQLADAEIIVVDAPAVTEVADALVIGAQVDASILVVDARATRRRVLHDAVRRLTPHARLLGSVVNRDDPERRPRRWAR